MTWWAILVTGLGTLAMKAVGPLVIGSREFPERIRRLLTLAAVSLLGALIAVSTFVAQGQVVLDARAAGVAAAGLLTWRGAPFPAVVVAAAVVAAAIRAVA